MIYLELFWSFFQVGLFSIGGGYAAMPLIQAQVVDQHGWLSLSEFIDVITISQMTPGPIGINSATFVGIKIAGIGGALVATLGCVLPSCIIVLTLAHFYFKYQSLTAVRGILNGLRPAVVAMIASAGLSILLNASFSGGRVSLFACRCKLDWYLSVSRGICRSAEMEAQSNLGYAGLRHTRHVSVSIFRYTGTIS